MVSPGSRIVRNSENGKGMKPQGCQHMNYSFPHGYEHFRWFFMKPLKSGVPSQNLRFPYLSFSRKKHVLKKSSKKSRSRPRNPGQEIQEEIQKKSRQEIQKKSSPLHIKSFNVWGLEFLFFSRFWRFSRTPENRLTQQNLNPGKQGEQLRISKSFARLKFF